MGTWKCDTGFKSDYLLQLEKMLAQTILGFGLKACPHIESRVKTLKKQTIAIADMFTIGSDFSWNEQDTMVQAEKAVFDLWVKSHPAAKGLRNKPFPYYDTLLEIFKKDRATRLGATTPVAEEEAIEVAAANECNASTQFDDGGFEGIEVSSVQPQPLPAGRLKQGRLNTSVSSSIKKLVDGTMVYLDKIGIALSEESTTKKQVTEELQKIPGLTLIEVLDVGKDISGDSYMVVVFFNLSDDKRKEMVAEVLRRRNPTG
ncbi:hypothetical protein L1049_013386 [Liquidambar formosana]|uniref:Myb/SANT-like domain-containing protein n=1 Tax=Liquidambar formosana TaxID=63359 RepID=A0AAP0RPX2_LIQFO